MAKNSYMILLSIVLIIVSATAVLAQTTTTNTATTTTATATTATTTTTQEPTTTTTATTATTTTTQESTTTSTTTTTTSSTTTTTCIPFAKSAVVPVQVVYADDTLYPPSDLEGSEGNLILKRSLRMVRNKPTTLVGTEAEGRVAGAEIKACETERKGKFKIKLNGAVIYETTQEVTVAPFGQSFFAFNNLEDSTRAVTAIPFVPGTPGVAGNNRIFWTPLQPFRFPAKGTAEITVEFADEEIGKTVVEKVMETVPLRVMWKGLVLDGHFNDNTITGNLAAEAATRAGGLPALFMKANYPVEDPEFKPTGSPVIGVLLPGTSATLTIWNSLPTDVKDDLLAAHAARRALSLKAIGLDRMILVVQDLRPNAAGWVHHSQKVAYVKEGSESSVDTHEIGHTKPFYLGDDYVLENNVITNRGRVAQGYLATLVEPTWTPSRPIDRTEAINTFGFMGAADFLHSVARKDQYRDIALNFDKDLNVGIDPKVWMFRGVLERENGDFSLTAFPIYKIKSTIDPAGEPCGSNPDCTTLTLRMTLKDDSIVEKVQTFHFGGGIDYTESTISNIAAVSDAVELPELKIKKITVLDENNEILFEQQVSPHKPNLKILKKDSSILAEVTEEDDETEADMGDDPIKSFKIKGTDSDGDTLHASLFIIDKDGNMDEIELDKPANGITVFNVDTRFLEPGKYKLLVYLTDGYNTVKKKVKIKI